MIFNNLARIIEEENVEEIVVEDPGENLVAEEVKNFVEKIKENFHSQFISKRIYDISSCESVSR